MAPLNYSARRPPAHSLASANRQPVIDIDDVHTLARGIVDTIRDPLLVLDRDLRVITANRTFCETFRMTRQKIENCPVYALGDGVWNIPVLRFLLENIDAAAHRDGGLRGRAGISRNRATLDAPECARGG
jgi:PAS domain-containing protein